MLEIETAGDCAVADFYDDRGSWEEFTGFELDPDEAPLAPDGRQYRKHRADDAVDHTPECYRTGDPIAPLSHARWRLANLAPDAERELIRRAQAGDKRAADELHRRFHKTILKIASETRFAALDWADRIAAGHRALWLAISRFNLGRNVRLAGYAKRCEALAEASWDEEDTDAAQREAMAIVHRVATGNVDHRDPFHRERQRVVGIEARVLKAAGCKVSRAAAPFALERLADDADRRLARRIALVGRRVAANELVERKRNLHKVQPSKEKDQWMIIVVSKRMATSWRSGHRDR